jgi:hypothetical protein
MNEIKLSVDDSNLQTVLTIVNNLKAGLIREIQTNGEKAKRKPTQYQPKTDTIIKEEESGTADRNGKYINPAVYKQRLKNKKSL